MRTDNPINDFYAYSNRQEEELNRLPKCSCCGEPIQSEYCYDIDGLYCEKCFEEWVEERRNDTERFAS